MSDGHDEGEARTHLRINVALLCMMTFLHFASVGSVIINVVIFTQRPATRPFLDDPESIGHMIAYVLCGLWAVGGVIVAPITAFGLGTRASWSRTLGQLYWALSLLTVCCLPVGVYGLWSLSRDDVKRALAPR